MDPNRHPGRNNKQQDPGCTQKAPGRPWCGAGEAGCVGAGGWGVAGGPVLPRCWLAQARCPSQEGTRRRGAQLWMRCGHLRAPDPACHTQWSRPHVSTCPCGFVTVSPTHRFRLDCLLRSFESVSPSHSARLCLLGPEVGPGQSVCRSLLPVPCAVPVSCVPASWRDGGVDLSPCAAGSQRHRVTSKQWRS